MRKRRQNRGWHQYFLGFKRRINCESVPRLPAIIVRYFLEAEEVERGSLVWSWMDESEIKESLTLHPMSGLSQIELKRGQRGIASTCVYLAQSPAQRWPGLDGGLPSLQASTSLSIRLAERWRMCATFTVAMPRVRRPKVQIRRHLHTPRMALLGRVSTHTPVEPRNRDLSKRSKLEFTIEHGKCY